STCTRGWSSVSVLAVCLVADLFEGVVEAVGAAAGSRDRAHVEVIDWLSLHLVRSSGGEALLVAAGGVVVLRHQLGFDVRAQPVIKGDGEINIERPRRRRSPGADS